MTAAEMVLARPGCVTAHRLKRGHGRLMQRICATRKPCTDDPSKVAYGWKADDQFEQGRWAAQLTAVRRGIPIVAE